MLIFKTLHDLKQLHPLDPAYSVVRERISALPGYVVLIEEDDTHIDLPELKGSFEEISWDGVLKENGYYHCVYLTNNEFALEFLIPKAAWLPDGLRKALEAHTA